MKRKKVQLHNKACRTGGTLSVKKNVDGLQKARGFVLRDTWDELTEKPVNRMLIVYLGCYVSRKVFWFSQGKNSHSHSQKNKIKIKNCLSLRKQTWSSKRKAFKYKEKEELIGSLMMESGAALMSYGRPVHWIWVLEEIGKRSWCRQEAFTLLLDDRRNLKTSG